MALKVKSGPMLWYKRRMFGRNWHEVHAVLYNDSSFIWYQDKTRDHQEGALVIKDAPEFVAYGLFTNIIPERPQLPDNYEVKQLLALGKRKKEDAFWFLCPSEPELTNWMTAISNTLPIQPQPPVAPQPPIEPNATPAPEATAPEANMVPLQHGPQQALLPQSNVPQLSPGIPGQYPSYGYPPPPYGAGPMQAGYPMASSRPYPTGVPNNTTVVVQDRGYGGGGDFAMGMLAGSTLTSTCGFGMGWCGGWGYSRPFINDTDVHVNNYYNYNNTEINNETNNGGITGDLLDGGDMSGDLMDGGDFDGGGADFVVF